MITLVLYPDYFEEADPRDIERELIGLVMDQAERDVRRDPLTMNPKLRRALLDGEVRCIIDKVRAYKYHPPSRPGWTCLSRVRWGKHKTRMIEVKWLPMT